MTLYSANRKPFILGAYLCERMGRWKSLSPDPIFKEDSEMPYERGSRKTLVRARFGMKPRKRILLAVTEEDEDIITPALERVEWRIIHQYPEETQAAIH